MRTIRWRHNSLSVSLCWRLVLFLFFGAWLSVGLLETLYLSGEERIVYFWSPWDDSMDTKMFRPPSTHIVNYAEVKDDSEYPDWTPSRLQNLLESPSSVCRRLTSLGGVISCRDCNTCKKDGNKFVCLDDDVRPVPKNCLIYSFGVGGETSWDRAMSHFNCDVYAFDMTMNWTNMAFDFGFHFLNLGLYHENYDSHLNMTDGDKKNPTYTAKTGYLRKLDSIRDVLGHTNRPIDILKMDIEFTEWDVFQNIFRSPEEAKVLDDVKQIALEIHLDDFKNSSAAARVAGGRRVESILEDMKNHGFHMVHTELNSAFQIHADVRGQVVPLFRESLFLHRP